MEIEKENKIKPENEELTRRPKKVAQTKKTYNKTYYEKHKAKVYELLYKQVLCEACQNAYSQHYLSKHRKTKFHLNNIKNNQA